MFYVYIYSDPRKSGDYSTIHSKLDYEPFYIGKGKNTYKRHLQHLKNNNSNNRKINKIAKLQSLGYDLKEYITLIQCGTEREALNLERELVLYYGRADFGLGPLTNHTNGGDGGKGDKFVSETTRKKLSESNKKYFNQPHIKEEIAERANNRWSDKKESEKWKSSIVDSEFHRKSVQKNGKKMNINKWSDGNKESSLKEHRKTHNKTYLITYPLGEEVMVDRMPQYCKENKLAYGCLLEVAKGNKSNWKGHTCKIIKGTYRDEL